MAGGAQLRHGRWRARSAAGPTRRPQAEAGPSAAAAAALGEWVGRRGWRSGRAESEAAERRRRGGRRAKGWEAAAGLPGGRVGVGCSAGGGAEAGETAAAAGGLGGAAPGVDLEPARGAAAAGLLLLLRRRVLAAGGGAGRARRVGLRPRPPGVDAAARLVAVAQLLRAC